MQWQLCSSLSHQTLRQCQTKATTAILTAYSPSKCYHSGRKFTFECLTHAKQCHHFGMIGEHLNAVKFISTRSINNKNFTIFCSINLDNKTVLSPDIVRNLRAKKPMKINFPSNKVCGIIHSTQPFVYERIL